ncbi:MAG: hypothetical protein P8X39_05130, partial [Desulfofustis sp.]
FSAAATASLIHLNISPVELSSAQSVFDHDECGLTLTVQGFARYDFRLARRVHIGSIRAAGDRIETGAHEEVGLMLIRLVEQITHQSALTRAP